MLLGELFCVRKRKKTRVDFFLLNNSLFLISFSIIACLLLGENILHFAYLNSKLMIFTASNTTSIYNNAVYTMQRHLNETIMYKLLNACAAGYFISFYFIFRMNNYSQFLFFNVRCSLNCTNHIFHSLYTFRAMCMCSSIYH